MEAHEQLAARHIALRERAGLTQEQEAKRAGVSPTTISGIESGKITRPHLKTLLKLARALGTDVGELRESGKAQAPSSQGSLFNNGVLEEQRADWDAVVRSARQLRERGQGRIKELLTLWRESKDRNEDPAERRPYLDEMGELLQEAYDARPTLLQAMTHQRFADQWPELQKADGFYDELRRLVQNAGLSIRTGNAQEVRPEAVEESEAA